MMVLCKRIENAFPILSFACACTKCLHGESMSMRVLRAQECTPYPPQTTDIFFFLRMGILPFHSFTVVPQPYQMANCYAVVGAISLTCTSVIH